jgi:hypothetical protein
MPQGNLFLPFKRLVTNALQPGFLDQQSAQWVSQRAGKYYNGVYGTPASGTTAAKAGATFRGSNQSTASLTVGLATTYTGLCLSNPAASGVNLCVKRVNIMLAAASNAGALGLITGWLAAGITVHTTPLNADIVNGYVGAATASGSIVGPAPQANLDAACTLVGTPIWDRWLAQVAASALVTSVNDLEEDLIVPPGGYVAVGSTAAQTSELLATFMWEEKPQ